MPLPNQPVSPGSWGPPPLTARPEGLLAALGIQSGGRYPQHLVDQLLPVYELGSWYREYNQTFRSATVNLTGTGVSGITDVGLAVPAGEIWVINRLGMLLDGATFGAGPGNWRCRLLRVNNQNGTPIAMSDELNVAVANAVNAHYGVAAAEPFPIILRPTVKLRVAWNSASVNGITAGNLLVSLGVTVCAI